jgi:hypothetical protein
MPEDVLFLKTEEHEVLYQYLQGLFLFNISKLTTDCYVCDFGFLPQSR